jgi:hypothetical protein
LSWWISHITEITFLRDHILKFETTLNNCVPIPKWDFSRNKTTSPRSPAMYCDAVTGHFCTSDLPASCFASTGCCRASCDEDDRYAADNLVYVRQDVCWFMCATSDAAIISGVPNTKIRKLIERGGNDWATAVSIACFDLIWDCHTISDFSLQPSS